MTNLEYTPLELASLTDLEDKNNIIDTPHQEKTSWGLPNSVLIVLMFPSIIFALFYGTFIDL